MSSERQETEVDRLISAILAKVEARKPVLAASLKYERIAWRREPDGQIEVNLALSF